MVAFKKLDSLTALCALIGIFGYLWDGSIPVLMIGPRSLRDLGGQPRAAAGRRR